MVEKCNFVIILRLRYKVQLELQVQLINFNEKYLITIFHQCLLTFKQFKAIQY